MLRVNIGCGATPTPGWTNFDNSLTVRLARVPGAVSALTRLGMVEPSQRHFAEVVKTSGIRWANAVHRIPLDDGSVRVLYSSHMVEHLDVVEVGTFLQEARRVLVPGGVLRLAVPDLGALADQYRTSGDADAFVRATMLTQPKPRGILPRAKSILVGNRHHHWMYDGASLVRMVASAGFDSVRALPPGVTGIPDPGELDLFERSEESVYVEGRKPER
jgi:ubiquinone/menaquinone biosynthesis C-methylase UbiE